MFADRIEQKKKVSAFERRIVQRERAATVGKYMRTKLDAVLKLIEPTNGRADEIDPAVVDAMDALRKTFASLCHELDMYAVADAIPQLKRAQSMRKAAEKTIAVPKPRITKTEQQVMAERRGKVAKKKDLHLTKLTKDMRERLNSGSQVSLTSFKNGFEKFCAEKKIKVEMPEIDECRVYVEDYKEEKERQKGHSGSWIWGYCVAKLIWRRRETA